mmetsp:Transcript_41827/g.65344  ORF Transcript_41827/g.65344 Transcript_41827/m.65344 type:complete len:255 (-) Transcript_41827:381-1145(-)
MNLRKDVASSKLSTPRTQMNRAPASAASAISSLQLASITASMPTLAHACTWLLIVSGGAPAAGIIMALAPYAAVSAIWMFSTGPACRRSTGHGPGKLPRANFFHSTKVVSEQCFSQRPEKGDEWQTCSPITFCRSSQLPRELVSTRIAADLPNLQTLDKCLTELKEPDCSPTSGTTVNIPDFFFKLFANAERTRPVSAPPCRILSIFSLIKSPRSESLSAKSVALLMSARCGVIRSNAPPVSSVLSPSASTSAE